MKGKGLRIFNCIPVMSLSANKNENEILSRFNDQTAGSSSTMLHRFIESEEIPQLLTSGPLVNIRSTLRCIADIKVSSFYFRSVWEFHNCNRVHFEI